MSNNNNKRVTTVQIWLQSKGQGSETSSLHSRHFHMGKDMERIGNHKATTSS